MEFGKKIRLVLCFDSKMYERMVQDIYDVEKAIYKVALSEKTYKQKVTIKDFIFFFPEQQEPMRFGEGSVEGLVKRIKKYGMSTVFCLFIQKGHPKQNYISYTKQTSTHKGQGPSRSNHGYDQQNQVKSKQEQPVVKKPEIKMIKKQKTYQQDQEDLYMFRNEVQTANKERENMFLKPPTQDGVKKQKISNQINKDVNSRGHIICASLKTLIHKQNQLKKQGKIKKEIVITAVRAKSAYK